MFRLPRYMTLRTVRAPDCVALNVIPVGHGETVGRITGSMRVISAPEISGSSSYVSPFGYLEWNYALWGVPWRVAATYSSGPDLAPAIPASQADWDAFCKRLVLTYSGTSNDYYGGNPDSKDNLDVRPPSGTERGPGDDQTKEPLATDAEMGLGPQGLTRFMADERWLMSGSRSTIGARITSPSWSDSTQLDDVNFLDSVDIDYSPMWSGPGYIILCAYRYKVAASKGFAASQGPSEDDSTSTHPVSLADKNRIFSAFYNGDYLRIRKLISDPTSDIAAYIRTLLFSGDVNINSLTNSGNPILAGLFSDNNLLRPNDLIIGTKMAAPTSTPYTIDPAFLG